MRIHAHVRLHFRISLPGAGMGETRSTSTPAGLSGEVQESLMCGTRRRRWLGDSGLTGPFSSGCLCEAVRCGFS